jgi:hypothetical protein
MPRPPFELRAMEMEERRRARVHQRLRWQARWRRVLWSVASLLTLAALAFLARLAGVAFGP